jgi:subfamily B ATP-binding cassette protein MsbA
MDIKTFKRLYNDYTKKYLNKILIAIFFSVLVAGSTSCIAYLLDPAIKKIFIDKDQTLIYLIPIAIIVTFAVKGFSLYYAKMLMIIVAQEVSKAVQSDIVKSLIGTDTQTLDNKHTGEFISNISYDVSLIVNLISTAMLNLFKDSLTLVGLLGVMFYQNWRLSLIAIVMIPLASFFAKSLGKRVGKITTQSQEYAASATSYLIEIFKNHKIIKIFQKEEYENIRADGYLNKMKNVSIKMNKIFIRVSPIMETLTGIMIAALIFSAGKLILNDNITINQFFSFLAAMMLAYQPIRSLATLNMAIQQGLSASKRILPVIDLKSKTIENIDDKPLNPSKGNIEFKNISFKYDKGEKDVLNSVNLKIEGGEMTSLVGHSGAGKSTILNLIPRFYDGNLGDILIDGQSIYKTTLYSLRKSISLVSQDITLFDDTIKANIAYANLNATDDEIKEAAKLSYAAEFIDKLPEKYDTKIGENGVRLSGGEKQRLSIARAMLKKSQIILLDEATSSLDADTENKIQEAITYLTKNRTTLVIAHRLSTILNSNKIYVIDNGSVVDNGTHKDLLESSKIYKNFYEKQVRRD